MYSITSSFFTSETDATFTWVASVPRSLKEPHCEVEKCLPERGVVQREWSSVYLAQDRPHRRRWLFFAIATEPFCNDSLASGVDGERSMVAI